MSIAELYEFPNIAGNLNSLVVQEIPLAGIKISETQIVGAKGFFPSLLKTNPRSMHILENGNTFLIT